LGNTDYRQLLKMELLARVKRNPKYSLRAFARDLSISNAFLSQVLNGNRSLSDEKGLHIASLLAWDSEKTELFLKLIRIDNCKDDGLRALLSKGLSDENDFYDLQVEKFESVSNWIHFAILELSRIRGFKSDSKWVARRLGIASLEVEDAVRRLIRLGLLKEVQGKWVLVRNSSVADAPSTAIRKFHKAHLEKASFAIERQPPDRRHFSGITTAINPKQLPVAAEMIKKFRRKLMKVLETGEKTGVYQISIQLFQLDQGAPQ
jgi:uncharacterized protein (TIGR02147 family)